VGLGVEVGEVDHHRHDHRLGVALLAQLPGGVLGVGHGQAGHRGELPELLPGPGDVGRRHRLPPGEERCRGDVVVVDEDGLLLLGQERRHGAAGREMVEQPVAGPGPQLPVVAGVAADGGVGLLDEDLALEARLPQHPPGVEDVVADGVAAGEDGEELVDGAQRGPDAAASPGPGAGSVAPPPSGARASSRASRSDRPSTRAESAARSAAASDWSRSVRSATARPSRAVASPRALTCWASTRTYQPISRWTACLTSRRSGPGLHSCGSTGTPAWWTTSWAAWRTSPGVASAAIQPVAARTASMASRGKPGAASSTRASATISSTAAAGGTALECAGSTALGGYSPDRPRRRIRPAPADHAPLQSF